MNIEQFANIYSGAPLDEVEFAGLVIAHLDNDTATSRELNNNAKDFLEMRDTFLAELEYHNIEIG